MVVGLEIRLPRMATLAAAALLCWLAAGEPGFAHGAVPGVLPPPKGVGDLVEPLALTDVNGGKRELTPPPWSGPVIVYFWSVYCANCKEAMPGLIRLYEEWQKRGVTVWAVNVDGDRFSNAVKAYAQEMALPFPIVMDRLEGELLVAADSLGVSKTPTLFLAGADGRVRVRQAVEVDYGAVAQALTELTR